MVRSVQPWTRPWLLLVLLQTSLNSLTSCTVVHIPKIYLIYLSALILIERIPFGPSNSLPHEPMIPTTQPAQCLVHLWIVWLKCSRATCFCSHNSSTVLCTLYRHHVWICVSTVADDILLRVILKLLQPLGFWPCAAFTFIQDSLWMAWHYIGNSLFVYLVPPLLQSQHP